MPDLARRLSFPLAPRFPLARYFPVALVALVATASTGRTQGGPPPLGPPPVPPANPITTAKTNLGKTLFWDEQLGSNKTVACGTCHVTLGGSDRRTSATNPASRHPGFDALFNTPDDVFGSPGTSLTEASGAYVDTANWGLAPQVTGRRSQSILNSAYPPNLFWDGRAGGEFRDPQTNAVLIPVGGALENQVLGPPVSSVEMAHAGRDWNDVAARVAASKPLRLSPQVPGALANWINDRSYPALFQEAFGTNAVTPARIAMAIATYERTLWTGQAPIDQFFAGNPNALTAAELRGQAVFNGEGRCTTCHGGNQFTGHGFRYIGLRPQNEDLGRFAVTNQIGDRGRMKVPSLRNVELRAPYFHNGQMATLEDVIAFYNRGGDFAAPNKDPNILPLGLTTQQRADLAVFLRRPLTDPRVVAGTAPFDRPLLASESDELRPIVIGAGTAGRGDIVPQIVALEPAYAGNPRYTLALDGLTPGATAYLLVSRVSTPPTPFDSALLYVPSSGRTFLSRALAHGPGPGQGIASATFALPADPSFWAGRFYAQWLVLDPNRKGNSSASAALEIPSF